MRALSPSDISKHKSAAELVAELQETERDNRAALDEAHAELARLRARLEELEKQENELVRVRTERDELKRDYSLCITFTKSIVGAFFFAARNLYVEKDIETMVDETGIQITGKPNVKKAFLGYDYESWDITLTAAGGQWREPFIGMMTNASSLPIDASPESAR